MWWTSSSRRTAPATTAASTAKETERLLRREFIPLWEQQPLPAIRKADIIAALDAMVKRGSPSIANHAFAAVRKLFNWSIGRGYLETSPCIGIPAPRNTTAGTASSRTTN